jgi:hypothetical protein
MARLQLLRYLTRLLTQWYEQNKPRLPLPMVLPLLAHQGPEGWKLSCEFTDLFGAAPEALRPYLPSFRHLLVDLAPMRDSALSAESRLRAYLKALKYCRRRDLPERMKVVLAEAVWLDDRDLFAILDYLDKSPVTVNINAMREALEQLVPDRKERIMGWFSQPFYEEGFAEGEAKGEARGEARGEAKIFIRLLEKQFGEIPASVRQRISTADAESIEAWVERSFDAPDLQSVFGTN